MKVGLARGKASTQLVAVEPPEFVGHSADVEVLRRLIDAVSGRMCTVLICGESGTGKELVARQIHASGLRADRPFVPVDCTTLSDTLIESQLFGHEKGAFTGADRASLGFFRAADGGTLFLDEVGELPTAMQSKLLRCLEEQAVVPLGGVEAVPIDVRVLAATHRDLKAMVARGEFREDLYFRLNVVRIEVPPLRTRKSDLVCLAEHFLKRQAELYDERLKTLSSDAISALMAYDWPGNVRELANAIEHAYVLSGDDTIAARDLPTFVQAASVSDLTSGDGPVVPLAVAERALITRALQAANGNRSRAATMLQIDRRRLYRKIRSYGLHINCL